LKHSVLAAKFVSVLIMLQTEEERQLRKMVRREEKKLTRRNYNDRDVDSAQGSFNPQDLRSQRFLSGFKFTVLLLWSVCQLV